MRIIKNSLLLFIVLIGCFPSSAQSTTERMSKGKVFRKEERPNLSIEYSKIGRFKLAARKSIYHIGEMIDLAGAVINDTEQDVFLEELDPEFYLSNEKGQELKIQHYGIGDPLFSEDSFELTEPNGITFKAFELLAGCNDKTERILNTEVLPDDKQIFERGLFAMLYIGPCLKIREPGIYTLKARQENQFVVESTKKAGVKTATGIIESAPIRIKIVK